MSVKELSEYIRVSKYALYLPEKKRRETWKEQVDRVFDMHKQKYADIYEDIKEDVEFAKDMMLKKRILGSQRALQFGGDPILKKEIRLYNCSGTYIDRPRVFQEIIFILLAGGGVGFSVQKHHIAKLPKITERTKSVKTFIIPDSIEGWGDAIGVLMSSYFDTDKTPFPTYRGKSVNFDYSKIRPKGSPLSSGSKAPGPDGLRASIEHITTLLDECSKKQRKLKSINVYDIIMYISESVISGGVRRSATICLFSKDDEEMRCAKTGDWMITNPQRARSNNSVILLRNKTTKEEFSNIMKSVQEFGEPGFVWVDDLETLYNPCNEAGMYAYDQDGNSGFSLCNLSEINMKKCKEDKDFYEACRAASILGTLQAGYTEFTYLGDVTERIVKQEALIGVSMTGMMDNVDISFDPNIQKHGAEIVKSTNKLIAKKINILTSARCTLNKPSGTSSCLLGTSSGIHLNHSKRYFRRVQANKIETPLQYFYKVNPQAVEESVWSPNGTDVVITFLCESSNNSRTKCDMDALTMLEHVRITQQNWIAYGKNIDRCMKPSISHAVSNTISVRLDEWSAVEDYIYTNRKYFAGVALLPSSGDKDFPQAPFCKIPSLKEIMKDYGECSMFASGLIETALETFGDLWKASDCALGIGESLELTDDEKNLKNGKLKVIVDDKFHKTHCIDKIKLFAKKYMDNDVRKVTYLMKDVYNNKRWIDLKRDYKEVDWEKCIEEQDVVNFSETISCAGGSCSII